MSLYENVPVCECIREIGRQPISLRWIDINKGDDVNPNYKSRLVAREINIHKGEDLFAATPPLEAMKAVLSMTATANKGEILMTNDISRAFFHAKVKRDVYVQLAEEDRGPHEEGICGKLRYSMYGTRDAAQHWFEEYSSQLCSVGFRQGRATPCVFYHPERRIRTMVHGDDYVSTGMPKDVEWMNLQFESKYTVKTQLLGPGPNEVKQVKILNRIITWDGKQGIIYEADPRHVEIVVDQLQLDDAKLVTTPGTKEEGRTQEGMDTGLDPERASRYPALVARCNYLALGRPDVAFSVNELARRMATPTAGDWLRLKRFGRYLKGRPRLQQTFEWQAARTIMKTFSDADWAGRKQTRRSTTGGCITIGAHTIKSWSKTQSFIALSSAESELYAAVKASAGTLGMMAMMADLGYTLQGEVWDDASAALGIINRNGLGKTRHIDTSLLWVQETAAPQRLKYEKVLGRENLADLYTKYLDTGTMDHHVRILKHKHQEGRAEEAPRFHAISQSIDAYFTDKNCENWKWLDQAAGYEERRRRCARDQRQQRQ